MMMKMMTAPVRKRGTNGRLAIGVAANKRPESHDGTQPFPRHDRRTIYFAGLPAGTTHKDLVRVLRGGRILDIYLRKDRSAAVSFVEGAQEFLKYAKRRDIYIHQKRVSQSAIAAIGPG